MSCTDRQHAQEGYDKTKGSSNKRNIAAKPSLFRPNGMLRFKTQELHVYVVSYVYYALCCICMLNRRDTFADMDMVTFIH